MSDHIFRELFYPTAEGASDSKISSQGMPAGIHHPAAQADADSSFRH
jgi:hypothetical protein